jgi:hypothetical protein
MPESPRERALLLGLAHQLGPLMDHGLVVHGVRIGDLREEMGARTPTAQASLSAAIDPLVRGGALSLEAFPGTEPLADPATRVRLTERGLLAARAHEPTLGRPHPDQARGLVVDLGESFSDGQLHAARVISRPPALGQRMTEEPWVLPALLLLGLEPRWYLNVLAMLLQFLGRQARIELGGPKNVVTAKSLGDRCAALRPFLPAFYLGKDRGQRTVDLLGALPELSCTTGGQPVDRETVDAILRRAFGLAGIDPLARIARRGRAGREAMGGEDDAGGEGTEGDADLPEE